MSTDSIVADDELAKLDKTESETDSKPEPEPKPRKAAKPVKAPKAAKPAKIPKPVPVKTVKAAPPVKNSQPAEDNAILSADHDDLIRVTELMSLGSDITRVKLLAAVDGIRTVGDLSNLMSQSQPATSHHIALLRAARLVVRGREGKNNLYDLTKDGEKLLKIVSKLLASE
jgi:DNA-binding transcriptional ArsR family regulator